MGNLDGKKQPGLQRQARLCNWNSIKAIALAREWGSRQILSSPLTAVPPLLIHVPPLLIHVPPNCIIIKFDAAWNETLNVAGLGWIVEAEDRISAFSVPAHHVRFPLAAEALALREEIWKCRKQTYKNPLRIGLRSASESAKKRHILDWSLWDLDWFPSSYFIFWMYFF